jgi:outer membrane protein
MQAAKSDADRQAIYQQYNKSVADKQETLLKPLVDQTKKATADVAGTKKLLLVVDRADVIYGGTDITADVQNALTK